jgi:ankyrin repeat protein
VDAVATFVGGNGEVRGRKPLIFHAANTVMLRLLVERGAPVRATDSDGNTLLHYAAAHLDGAAVEFLLGKGLSATERNAAGRTPLDLARDAANRSAFAALTKVWK